MRTQHTGPLPEGWTLKDGFINYQADDYHKHVLDKSGRIDRNTVALTLENYGYPDHARRWFLSPLEVAAPELLEACKAALDCLEKLGAGDYTTADYLRHTIKQENARRLI